MPLVLDPPSRNVEQREDSLAGGGRPPGDDDHDGFGGGDDDDAGDASGDSPDNSRPWVTLATFWHPAEAHIARLRLEAGGVPCVLLDELTAATHVFALAVGGVKLQVPPAQWRLASRLLHEHRRLPAADHADEPASACLAAYARLTDAKAAACVVEAQGLSCQVREHEPVSRPSWARLLPGRWRTQLWPAATVAVDRPDLREAAVALGRTPLGAGLTRQARRGRCGTCCADSRWSSWQLHWSAGQAPGSFRLPRLVRRCGRCGEAW